jgi:hypothetical protein
VLHNPAFAGALIDARVAELQRSAGAAFRGRSEPRRPDVIATARQATGWLLIDMGLRLAVPRCATSRPVAGGPRAREL